MGVYRCRQCGQLNRVPERPSKGRATCGKCRNALDELGLPQEVKGDEAQRTASSSPVPVLVDVWAPWCGPCRMIAPVLESLAKERKGELIVLKVNSDENPKFAQRHSVQGLPTVLLLDKGREVSRLTGAHPKPSFENWLNANTKHSGGVGHR